MSRNITEDDPSSVQVVSEPSVTNGIGFTPNFAEMEKRLIWDVYQKSLQMADLEYKTDSEDEMMDSMSEYADARYALTIFQSLSRNMVAVRQSEDKKQRQSILAEIGRRLAAAETI
jgi:hypothetical protein